MSDDNIKDNRSDDQPKSDDSKTKDNVSDDKQQQTKTYTEVEFKEVVAQRQALKKQLNELEKKLNDYEQTIQAKDTEYKKMQEEIDKLKLEYEEAKKLADAYREQQKIEREKLKQILGDAWVAEYESDDFSLSSLRKLAESLGKIAVVTGIPKRKTDDLTSVDKIKLGLTQK